MSKSKPAQSIWLVDPPSEVYGKVMAIDDKLMPHYFEWATELPLDEVRATLDALAGKELHPREAKRKLARTITTELHSAAAADEAEREFDRVHKDRQAPDEVRRVRVEHLNPSTSLVSELLTSTGLAPSKTSALRLIDQGGVRINEILVKANAPISTIAPSAGASDGLLVQVGRRNFVRVSFG
jgi:tyrosyl-tRNA synthetase